MKFATFLLSCLLTVSLWGWEWDYRPDIFKAIREGNNEYAKEQILQMRYPEFCLERLNLYVPHLFSPDEVDPYPNQSFLDVAAIDVANFELVEFLLPRIPSDIKACTVPEELKYRDGALLSDYKAKKILYHTTFYRVIEKGNFDVITLFYRFHGNIFRKVDNAGSTLFGIVAGREDRQEVIKAALLGTMKSDLPITEDLIELFDSYGRREGNPVTIALNEGNFEVVDLFFRYGVPIQSEYLMRASDNFALLDFYIEKGYLTLEKLLLWQKDSLSYALSLYEKGYIDLGRLQELLRVVPQENWNKAGVERLLTLYELGYLPFTDCLERFKALAPLPLHRAVEIERFDLIEALIAQMSQEQINKSRPEGDSLFWLPDWSWSSYDPSMRKLETLLPVMDQRYNALETAIVKGDLEIVRLLLQAGADPFFPRRDYRVIGKYGYRNVISDLYMETTPLYLALVREETALVDLMLNYAKDLTLPLFSEGVLELDVKNKISTRLLESLTLSDYQNRQLLLY